MRTQTKSYYICGLSARIRFLLIFLVGCCIVISEVEKAYSTFSASIEIMDYNAEEGEKESKKENLKKKDKLEKITSSFTSLSLQYHLALSANFLLLSYGSESYLEPPFSPPDLVS